MILLCSGCLQHYRVNHEELQRARQAGGNTYIAAQYPDGDVTYIRARNVHPDVYELGDGTSTVKMRSDSTALWVLGGLSAVGAVLLFVTVDTSPSNTGDEAVGKGVGAAFQILGGVGLTLGALGMLIPNAVLAGRHDSEPSPGFALDVERLDEP